MRVARLTSRLLGRSRFAPGALGWLDPAADPDPGPGGGVRARGDEQVRDRCPSRIPHSGDKGDEAGEFAAIDSAAQARNPVLAKSGRAAALAGEPCFGADMWFLLGAGKALLDMRPTRM